MRYLDHRVGVICRELKSLSVVSRETIQHLLYKEGTFIFSEDAEKAEQPWEDFDSLTMHWYGKDRHYWFKAEYTIPENLSGKEVWLEVKTQIDEWDDARNPQFLLFLDGEPVQGLDMNHRRVLLTREAEAGRTYQFGLQAYTGTLHSEFRLIPEILQIDHQIESLYYDLAVPMRSFSRMKDETLKMEITEVLNACVNRLDLRNPYSPEFYASLSEASAYLQKALYEDLIGFQDIIATCIGHTHIDVAWMWTVEQVREKTGRSFATVLKLMDEYPNYKFMSSQPQLYEFLKERYPKLYAKVKERVAQGRWEPEGGMWVEADCNLTSGESLVRQFLHGKRFFKEEFGVDNRILWLPDVFGYSAALPQIMKRSGIDYFMTTKLAWNQINKIPHDTFMWRGIDGTEILTHMVTTLGVGQDVKNFFTTYNGMLHPDAIMGGWERYLDKNINNDILISYGYGDGGGGPTRDMLETSMRMEKGIKGIPKVRQEFSRTYFEELEERVKDNNRLAKWEGELYFEYHRGTYTSMGRNKRSNRKSEFMMMDLELLSVLTGQYPSDDLAWMWKLTMRNQFHDILPGTSIKEVYEVTREEYAQIEEKAKRLIDERLSLLAPADDAVTVFNTLGFERNGVVKLDEDICADALVSGDGKVYPIQKTQDGSVVYLEGIPSKGWKVFSRVSEMTDGEKKSPITITEHGVDTPFYHAELDENGLFTSIYDKEFDREIIREGQKGNLIRMYEDKPMNYDNWDIDMYYTEKSWDVTGVDDMRWVENGPVRAALQITRSVSNSKIFQTICFYADSRRIDFETKIDWKESQHLLKVHFPMDVHSDEAAFDIQFGNVTRKIHTNTSWDEARFESCGQKWMDFSEGHYGVSIMNDCKYGHSAKDGCLGLTLLKSGISPNETTDQEEHIMTYSLYPHGEGFREGGTIQEAYQLNVPAYAKAGKAAQESYSMVSVDKRNLILETVKQAEDASGMILRIYEDENARTKARVTVNREDISGVVECNLMEEEERTLTFADGGFDIDVRPYEIKTYKLIYK